MLKNQELRISEAGEELINEVFPVLDKGYIKLISYHGTDQLIEAAARISYQAGTRKVSDTEKLINYLTKHEHMSPFEQPCLIFEVKAPIFVLRQWHRHRTAKINEVSGRYSELTEDVLQYSEEFPWRTQSSDNKQGSEGEIDYQIGLELTGEQNKLHGDILSMYRNCLDNDVAREVARAILPVSTYSTMYWQSDLRNLLHFLRLRTDSHAQLEIREYANVMERIAGKLFPLTYKAWVNHVKDAMTLSAEECGVMREITQYLTSHMLDKPEDNVKYAHTALSKLYPKKKDMQEFIEKMRKVCFL